MTRCVVQYWFESDREHLVPIKAHGNSKVKTNTYCRTHPSTLDVLKNQANYLLPKGAVAAVYSSEGGMMQASSLGKLPRNREQVAKMRRGNNFSICSNKGLKDPLFQVMEQSKLCGDKFVRIVTTSPEPMCVLASDQQLKDLQRFSTSPKQFCIASIDPTFSLEEFSVTCITYQHLLVTDRRTGESPVMLGPVFVHQRKAFETYHFFASSLISLNPSLDKLLAFGTDGEESLQLAFRKQFKFAVILRCFRHLRQNIKRKLVSDMGVTEDDSQEILSHIFGVRSGPTLFEGLQLMKANSRPNC